MNFKFETYFPHPKIRTTQSESIQKILDAYVNKGKRYVVLEAGTGVGKSAIGMTVSRYMNNNVDTSFSEEHSEGTYFLTTQKILQEQYVKDFGKPRGKMCSIKSSSNYQCSYHKKNTCQESQRLPQDYSPLKNN